MVSQLALLVAVHAKPAGKARFSDPLPPVAGSAWPPSAKGTRGSAFSITTRVPGGSCWSLAMAGSKLDLPPAALKAAEDFHRRERQIHQTVSLPLSHRHAEPPRSEPRWHR